MLKSNIRDEHTYTEFEILGTNSPASKVICLIPSLAERLRVHCGSSSILNHSTLPADVFSLVSRFAGYDVGALL